MSVSREVYVRRCVCERVGESRRAKCTWQREKKEKKKRRREERESGGYLYSRLVNGKIMTIFPATVSKQ